MVADPFGRAFTDPVRLAAGERSPLNPGPFNLQATSENLGERHLSRDVSTARSGSQGVTPLASVPLPGIRYTGGALALLVGAWLPVGIGFRIRLLQGAGLSGLWLVDDASVECKWMRLSVSVPPGSRGHELLAQCHVAA